MNGELLPELISYSNAVIAGEIIACQKHKWACERFLRDLDRIGSPDFPFIWVDKRPYDFIYKWFPLFNHSKGPLAGKPKIAEPIEKFIFGNIYGWVRKDTGFRRFRFALWQIARKNAKSQDMAIFALYEMSAFGEQNAEGYVAATKREQTQYVFDEAEWIYRHANHPRIRKAFSRAAGAIFHKKSGSKLKRFTQDDKKGGGDGGNPQFGIIDEYHAHPTEEYYDLLTSGMKVRVQPILFVITTAGFNLNNPAYRIEYQYAAKILNPDLEFNNDEYFVMINELDKNEKGELIDDIKDEKAWIKANPILALTDVGLASIRSNLKLAQDKPEKMRDFLTKTMDVWIDQRAHGFMNMQKWARCGIVPGSREMPDLSGRYCYIGFDLASKIDLASVAFEFKNEDDTYFIFQHSFMPEEQFDIKRKTDRVPYDLWEKQGWLTITPGSVIDYELVLDYVNEQLIKNNWKALEWCFDPWSAAQIILKLEKQGKTCVEIIQGIKTLSEPTKNFRDLVYSGKILHMNDPVLGWAISNAVAESQDRNQNILLDKKRSPERIDPIAACINAHVRAMVAEKPRRPRVFFV